MKNRKISLTFLFVSLLLFGCQEKEESPYDVLDDFIETWGGFGFEEMYDTYLTSSSKENVSYEVFSERYEKLYGDLEVENLAIDILDREQTWEEETSVTIPGSISFDTFAGEVDYTIDFVLSKEEREDETNWYVDWNPGLILPGLELTDKVRIDPPTPAERGEIVDNEGNKLAENGEVFEIGVIPGKFNEDDLADLSKIIGVGEEYIKSQYTLSWAQDDYVMPVKKFLREEEETVRAAEEIEGVSVNRVNERIYPYGEAAAHLIGYIEEVSAEDLEELEGYSPGDRVGKRGLEQLLEKRLKATDGQKIYLEKEDGSEPVVAETEPSDGETIQLTINANTQQTLFETLSEDAGTATVIDPTTGKVRSLVSVPTFDPNDYVLGMSNEQRQELENDEAKPTMSRLSYTYSPGSTMKLLTAIIGLDNGTLDPDHFYDIDVKQWQKDDSWGDYEVTRYYEEYDKVNLERGLTYSDNIYFARVGLDMGASKFEEGLTNLGIGESLPFIYPTAETSQISNSGSIESEILLADTAYGQGEFLLNMVHLASIYGGVANDGVMMQPLLLEEEEETVWKESIVSEEQAKSLQTILRKVVSEGSSTRANVSGREMAGKTGTVEMKQEQGTTGTENGLFVAMDQKDPTLLTVMLIEGVEKTEPRGSVYTVDLTKQFYESLNN
ncbi:penicillin-binding transpeptidase domain-containing protein [Jeotgalibacillus marinus]|uniref:Penicillin-binding transpeptidase domain-containing protein n=1 Tax=Jeotgalibacillus marinus TaxID=86667 RepID=A0ABV3Q1H8_9BACL